jgi:1-acyl-sn-glycerol-3-phosphate acyltransferase
MVLINIGVFIYIFIQVPEFTLRFVVWMLSHSLYRIRHSGIENVPERGAALIVCNHVSYIDALVLAGAVRRPIRFIMAKDIYDAPVLNYLFRTARTIPIYPKHKDEGKLDLSRDKVIGCHANGYRKSTRFFKIGTLTARCGETRRLRCSTHVESAGR